MAKVSGSNLYPQTATNVHDLSVWRNDFSMPTLSPTSSVVDIRANRDAALDNFSVSIFSFLLYFYKGVFIATQLNSTQLNSTARLWRHKQKHDWIGSRWLAVRCSTGSVELSWVQFSWVELCRYKRAFRCKVGCWERPLQDAAGWGLTDRLLQDVL